MNSAIDLDNMWNVVAEAIQTILRREGYGKAIRNAQGSDNE